MCLCIAGWQKMVSKFVAEPTTLIARHLTMSGFVTCLLKSLVHSWCGPVRLICPTELISAAADMLNLPQIAYIVYFR